VEERPRFLVDRNAGRLAKWLRALGYDVTLAPDLADRDLLDLARREGRVLLTRDRRIFHRRTVASGQVRALLLHAERTWDQLGEVASALGLDPSRAFTRCLVCNQETRPASPEEVRERVPPFVLRTQQEFRTCPRCGRVYWKGTHWRKMREELRRSGVLAGPAEE